MKLKICLICLIMLVPFLLFAQEEQLTITTYYPSPYGSYNELHTSQMAIGLNYQKTTPPANSLIVEGDVGIGTTGPQADLEVNNTLRLNPTTAPNHTVEGSLYYDSFSKKVKYHNGSGWQPMGGLSKVYDSGWVTKTLSGGRTNFTTGQDLPDYNGPEPDFAVVKFSSAISNPSKPIILQIVNSDTSSNYNGGCDMLYWENTKQVTVRFGFYFGPYIVDEVTYNYRFLKTGSLRVILYTAG